MEAPQENNQPAVPEVAPLPPTPPRMPRAPKRTKLQVIITRLGFRIRRLERELQLQGHDAIKLRKLERALEKRKAERAELIFHYQKQHRDGSNGGEAPPPPPPPPPPAAGTAAAAVN